MSGLSCVQLVLRVRCGHTHNLHSTQHCYAAAAAPVTILTVRLLWDIWATTQARPTQHERHTLPGE